MRRKYLVIVVVLLALAFGVGRLSAAPGTLDSPAPPDSTSSYSLEDIYNRLESGVAGAQSTFTEPSSGPTVGTGHTLNEIMATAPAGDNTSGAGSGDVLAGTTYWSLRTDSPWAWGPKAGTMPNNGAVTILPTTTDQAIAEGYHNGSGYVEGDADLVAGNIKIGVTIFGVTGTSSVAPVAKTGQTTSYATGDDGDLEKGVAWPSPRFTDNGDGTVTDNLTGLIWLKNANCFGSKSWSQALSDANTLNSPECGLSDGSVEGEWRLPNVRELHSLVHYGVIDLAVPNAAGAGKWTEGDPFTGIQSGNYWSSTSYAGHLDYAWIVYLVNGYMLYDSKTQALYVWPVRGGQ